MDTSTSTIAEQLSLSLRAWPPRTADTDSLPFLISRINEQRGGFRNVTEQSLEEEIRAIDAGDTNPTGNNVDSQEDGAPDLKSQRDGVVAAREEIIKQIVQAQMESAYALDFVSLLLSKYTPRQAEISISPFLKQNVPMGSIGTEIVQLPQVLESQTSDDKITSTGWKLQSLNAAADSLLTSATRLEKEMDRETKYWEQVLAIKERRWSVCRLPREKHTLGVRYGFAEAAPEFRDRGLAALRRGETGDIDLDLGIRASEPRLLRVQVEERGEIIASSEANEARLRSNDTVEGSILQARNSIFDEELYHELHREARNLTNRGIRCIGDTIVVPLEDDKRILIDLVSRTDDLLETPQQVHNLAAMVALSLRILLSHAHRQNLIRRSQPPPPLTERRPPRQTYAILRPMLAHLQHHSTKSSMQSFLHEVCSIFHNAHLDFDIGQTTSSFNLSNIAKLAPSASTPFVETLINSVCAPLNSSIPITLPSKSSSLTIHIRTHLMGTEYKSTITSSHPQSTLSTLPPETHFTSPTEIEAHILHLITLDLVSLIESNPENGGWKAECPHLGQLRAIRGDKDKEKRNRSQMLTVSLQRNKLEASWTGLGGGGGIDAAAATGGTYIWRGDGDGDGDGDTSDENGSIKKSLFDVMRSAAGRGGD